MIRKFEVTLDIPEFDYISAEYSNDIKELIDGDLNQDCKDRIEITVKEITDL